MVKLFAKFDPVIKEHLRQIQCEAIHDHYLGKTIQNELINLMGSKVRETIITWIKKAKYYIYHHFRLYTRQVIRNNSHLQLDLSKWMILQKYQ